MTADLPTSAARPGICILADVSAGGCFWAYNAADLAAGQKLYLKTNDGSKVVDTETGAMADFGASHPVIPAAVKIVPAS